MPHYRVPSPDAVGATYARVRAVVEGRGDRAVRDPCPEGVDVNRKAKELYAHVIAAHGGRVAR